MRLQKEINSSNDNYKKYEEKLKKLNKQIE